MSGVGDRLEPALAQRLADDARNQVVRHVVQNLVLVALPDDGRRHLARAKPGHARGFACSPWPRARSRRRRRQVRNLEGDVLAGLGDVGELGLHLAVHIITYAGRWDSWDLRLETLGPELKHSCQAPSLKPQAPSRIAVRKEGLEPPRPFGHRLLRLARLPFRHFRALEASGQSYRPAPEVALSRPDIEPSGRLSWTSSVVPAAGLGRRRRIAET